MIDKATRIRKVGDDTSQSYYNYQKFSSVALKNFDLLGNDSLSQTTGTKKISYS